jgi:hypothetical protein
MWLSIGVGQRTPLPNPSRMRQRICPGFRWMQGTQWHSSVEPDPYNPSHGPSQSPWSPLPDPRQVAARIFRTNSSSRRPVPFHSILARRSARRGRPREWPMLFGSSLNGNARSLSRIANCLTIFPAAPGGQSAVHASWLGVHGPPQQLGGRREDGRPVD